MTFLDIRPIRPNSMIVRAIAAGNIDDVVVSDDLNNEQWATIAKTTLTEKRTLEYCCRK